MRAQKTRYVKCEPGERCFKPQCCQKQPAERVCLTIDELEAIRLADLEKLTQEQVALNMRVHRSTVSRILASAHQKIADAFVNIKSVRIEGGCCKISKSKRGDENGKPKIREEKRIVE